MKHVFIDANSVRWRRSAEYLARPCKTVFCLKCSFSRKDFHTYLQRFLSAGNKPWKTKSCPSLLSLQEGASTVTMDGKTLTLTAGDSLLVRAQSLWVEMSDSIAWFPRLQQHKFCLFGPYQAGHQLVQKHSFCDCRTCNSLHYSLGQKCLLEETKPGIHSSSPCMIKLSKIKDKHQEKAANKRPCIKVDGKNTNTKWQQQIL